MVTVPYRTVQYGTVPLSLRARERFESERGRAASQNTPLSKCAFKAKSPDGGAMTVSSDPINGVLAERKSLSEETRWFFVRHAYLKLARCGAYRAAHQRYGTVRYVQYARTAPRVGGYGTLRVSVWFAPGRWEFRRTPHDPCHAQERNMLQLA